MCRGRVRSVFSPSWVGGGWRVAAAALAVCASGADALVLDQDYRRVVTNAGAGGYEAFPDVTLLDDGRLMTVFYAGYDHVSSPSPALPAGGRICYAISSDQGLTWSTARTLFDSADDDRDSSIAQLPDGRLAMNFFKGPSGNVFISYSSDVGKTWSAEQFVMSSYATSSPIRRLQSGRLVLPLYRSVSLSNNGGQSWQFVEIPSARPSAVGTDLTETDVVQLANGHLYAVHRADGGAAMRYTLSSDDGQTWGATLPLPFQGHSPYLLRTSSDLLLLAYRDPVDNTTKLRSSVNQGGTWSAPVLIDNVPGAYPSMAQLRDGSIFVTYYEEGAGSNIRTRRFTASAQGISFLPMTKAPAGETVYNEIFSSGGSSAVQDYGWHYFRQVGQTLYDEMTWPGAGVVANVTGAPVEQPPANSNPVAPPGATGYLYMGGGASAAKNLIYTDEYVLHPSTGNGFTLSWQSASDSANESYRPALRIAGQWFVTSDDVSAITYGDWQLGRVTVEADFYRWSKLALSAQAMTLGDPVGALPPGDVTGFGLFNESQLGNIRLDNFRITVAPVTPNQWSSNISGSWHTPSSWTSSTVPNGVDATGRLWGNITTPQTVYTNSAIVLGMLSFDSAIGYQIAGQGSLSMEVSSGTGLIEVKQGSHKINLPLVLNDSTTAEVAGGATLLIADPLTLAGGSVLSKTGGGSLVVEAPLRQAGGTGVLAVQGGTAELNYPAGAAALASQAAEASLEVRVSGSRLLLGADQNLRGLDVVTANPGDQELDLAGHAVRLYSADRAAQEQQAYADIQAARLSGSGRDGIYDSSVSGTAFAVGITDQAVDAHGDLHVLVKLTRVGDANLDGIVNVGDLGVLATNWQQAGLWDNGDFTYDGLINVGDLGALASNWQQSVSGVGLADAMQALGLPQAAVPEPAAAAMAMCFSTMFARRRWAALRQTRRIDPARRASGAMPTRAGSVRTASKEPAGGTP